MDKKTILVVENNPDEQELMVLACEQSNIPHELIIVNDGKEALNYLFNQHNSPHSALNSRPALVLLDLNLPLMNGLEVLRRLRADQRTQDLPVIMVTVSEEPEHIDNSYRYGCNSYIHKPIDYHQFQRKLGQLLSYWLENKRFGNKFTTLIPEKNDF